MNSIDEQFQKEHTQIDAKITKTERNIKQFQIFAIVLFSLGLVIVVYGLFNINNLELNELGDFYAGTVGISWTLCSVVLIYIAFLGQKMQLQLQTKELKMSKYLFDKQVQDNNLKTKMEIHSKFQTEMRNIQRNFTNLVNTEGWNPTKDEDRNITIYWYFVFDEWFTCMKGGSVLESLWTDHYRFGVRSALKKTKFKARIDEILDAKNSFLGHAKDFKNEISSIKNEMTDEK